VEKRSSYRLSRVEEFLARLFINLASKRALDLLTRKVYNALKTATPVEIARAVESNTDLFRLAMSDEETSSLIRVVVRKYPDEIIKYAPRVKPSDVLIALLRLARDRNDQRVLTNLSYIVNDRKALLWFINNVDLVKNSLVQMAYDEKMRATNKHST